MRAGTLVYDLRRFAEAIWALADALDAEPEDGAPSVRLQAAWEDARVAARSTELAIMIISHSGRVQ